VDSHLSWLSPPSGLIFESNAIARYVARIRRDSGLYGSTFFESVSSRSMASPSSGGGCGHGEHRFKLPYLSSLRGSSGGKLHSSLS
jgi:hypothetical protein